MNRPGLIAASPAAARVGLPTQPRQHALQSSARAKFTARMKSSPSGSKMCDDAPSTFAENHIMSVDSQAPKTPEPSKIPEPPQPRPRKMTRAQKKLYSSLTAANGFSMENALRMLLAKEAQGHKKD